MKERPIIFSAPMVQAILKDLKTMTRQVVKRQQCMSGAPRNRFKAYTLDDGRFGFSSEDDLWVAPYGKPGDRLWVRETWRFKELETGEDFVEYAAGGEMCFPNDQWLDWTGNPFDSKWRPPIHMYRWMSRITLEVTGVRIERLHNINKDDALREGIERSSWKYSCEPYRNYSYPKMAPGRNCSTAIMSFCTLWDSINGKKHPWNNNPWVWVVDFKKI